MWLLRRDKGGESVKQRLSGAADRGRLSQPSPTHILDKHLGQAVLYKKAKTSL